MFAWKLLVCVVVLFVVADCDVGVLTEHNGEGIDPVDHHEGEDKEQSKRTVFDSNYGWAKHVKVNGKQKLLLGYSPVDLKYVPVVKPLVMRRPGGWRFKPRLQKRPRPVYQAPIKMNNGGWKPLVPVHVPAPPNMLMKPWQQQGWHGTRLAASKPFRPSAVDHVHHELHHDIHTEHGHHDIHTEHGHYDIHTEHGHHDIVQQGHVDLHHHEVTPHDHHLHLHQHDIQPHDHHLQVTPVVQPTPVVIHYDTPSIHVDKPALPVLPLGATFPLPVLQQHHQFIPQPNAVPVLPQIPHGHIYPQYPGVYQLQGTPHYHVPQANEVTHLHPVPQVHQTPHIDLPVSNFHIPAAIPQFPHFHHQIPSVQAQIPAPHVHQIPEVPHAHQYPQITHLQHIPEVHQIAQVPHVHQIQEFPHIHQISPHLHQSHEVTHLHQIPQVPQFVHQHPEVHHVHKIPQVPQFLHQNPEVHHVHQIPQVPQFLHQNPEVHHVHQIPQVPHVQQIPTTPHFHQIPSVHPLQTPSINQLPPFETPGIHQFPPNVHPAQVPNINQLPPVQTPIFNQSPQEEPRIQHTPQIPQNPQIPSHIPQTPQQGYLPAQYTNQVQDYPQNQNNQIAIEYHGKGATSIPLEHLFRNNQQQYQDQQEQAGDQYQQLSGYQQDNVEYIAQQQQQQQHQEEYEQSNQAFPSGNGLHPGYTDLQLPIHLPQHPNLVSTDPQTFPNGIVQPNLALEPPYKK